MALAQLDHEFRLQQLTQTANRGNVTFYPVYARGLVAFDAPIGPDKPPSPIQDAANLRNRQETLRFLAADTDGTSVINTNNIDAALRRIVDDLSSYYLMGYYTTNIKLDGRFRSITVRVKRRDVNVRARRGFWAVTPTDAVRASTPTPEVAKPVQTALASIATSVQAGKYVRTWLGTERGEGGNTRVTLVWEPLTFPPGDRREPAGRVSLLAATAAGNVVFRGRAPDRPIVPAPTTGSLGAGGTSVAATAPAQRLTFDAPPGKVELRITVEGATGGTLDSEIRDIEVPDFTTPQVTLSTPRLYRARTLPELRTITADANAIPAAGREFSRTERVLIRFSAYAPGTERPEATAVLLNRGGTKMSDVPVTVSAIAGTTHEIALTLATVPAGEYLVEVTAKSAAGESKTLIPFRVTS